MAATKNLTPSVADDVAIAWTASVIARTAATPATEWVVKVIEPKWKSATAWRSVVVRRSLISPMMNSCPMR